MFRKIFGIGKNGATGVFRKVDKGMLRNFCFTSNMVRMITSGRMELVRYIAYVDN
jgi:hypothetical protein